jgi:hypothetical protein
MDLIHKQFRKPLESISPYFRYTQQLYFENAKDQVLDLVVTEGGQSSELPHSVLLAYRIDRGFLMFVQYELKPSKLNAGSKKNLMLNYQFI